MNWLRYQLVNPQTSNRPSNPSTSPLELALGCDHSIQRGARLSCYQMGHKGVGEPHGRTISMENGQTISRYFSSETRSSNISLLPDTILACCQMGCWAKIFSAVGNVVWQLTFEFCLSKFRIEGRSFANWFSFFSCSLAFNPSVYCEKTYRRQ